MAVYVDDSELPYGRMVMCHMIADTKEELLAFASKLGLKPSWIQRSNSGIVHFDLSLSKRTLAVRLGAQEVTSFELVRIAKGGGGA